MVGVFLKLAIATLRALDGNEQGRRVAEVVVGKKGDDARGQRRLEEVEAVLDLRPDLILVVDLVVEAHHDDAETVLRRGARLGAAHLAEGEQVALEGLGHLGLHLLGRGTRVGSYHHTLTDGECREFVLGHDVHAVDAQYEQDADDEQRY